MSPNIYSDCSLGTADNPIDLDPTCYQEEAGTHPPGPSHGLSMSAPASDAVKQTRSKKAPRFQMPKGTNSSSLVGRGYCISTFRSQSLWVTQEQFVQKSRCDGCAGELPHLDSKTFSTIFQNSNKLCDGDTQLLLLACDDPLCVNLCFQKLLQQPLITTKLSEDGDTTQNKVKLLQPLVSRVPGKLPRVKGATGQKGYRVCSQG